MSGHWTNRTGAWHTIMGRSMLREDEGTLGQFSKVRATRRECLENGIWVIISLPSGRPWVLMKFTVMEEAEWARHRMSGIIPTLTADIFIMAKLYLPRVFARMYFLIRQTNSSPRATDCPFLLTYRPMHLMDHCIVRKNTLICTRISIPSGSISGNDYQY